MKVLVANLGSTSFKYRLFDMTDERLLARGGVERIGSPESKAFVEAGGRREDFTVQAKDHAAAVRLCLAQLSDPQRACLRDPAELGAIGFKAVHAKRSEEHTSELQSDSDLVCRLLLEKKNTNALYRIARYPVERQPSLGACQPRKH